MGKRNVKSAQNLVLLVVKRLVYCALLGGFAGLAAFGLCGLAACVAIVISHWSR